jgi:hypothetical protein
MTEHDIAKHQTIGRAAKGPQSLLSDESMQNLRLHPRYVQHLKYLVSKQLNTFRARRQSALEAIAQDLDALTGNNHRLDQSVADELICLLIKARQELRSADPLAHPASQCLRTTAQQIKTLIQRAERKVRV